MIILRFLTLFRFCRENIFIVDTPLGHFGKSKPIIFEKKSERSQVRS